MGTFTSCDFTEALSCTFHCQGLFPLPVNSLDGIDAIPVTNTLITIGAIIQRVALYLYSYVVINHLVNGRQTTLTAHLSQTMQSKTAVS